MENYENIPNGITCQDASKQEIDKHPVSICEIKEEIMCCQSCSYSDADFDRLKTHVLREHPTDAAIVANTFKEENCHLHDIKLFCIKDTCSFFTNLCNVFEEHLMSCCPIHQTLSENEKKRLKSTLKFIVDFHKKHSFSAVCGFMDYISSFNTTLTCSDDKVPILTHSINVLDIPAFSGNIKMNFKKSISSFSAPVLLGTIQNTDLNSIISILNIHEKTSLSNGEQERNNEQLTNTGPNKSTHTSTSKGETVLNEPGHDSHIISNEVTLEIDIAGPPISIDSLIEVKNEDKTEENAKIYYGDGCMKDLNVSNQQTVETTGMTVVTRSTDHTCQLSNDVVKADTGYFIIDSMQDSCNLHFDQKVASDSKLLEINGNFERFSQNGYLSQLKRMSEAGRIFNEHENFTLNSNTMHTSKQALEHDEMDNGFLKDDLDIHPISTDAGERLFKCNECDDSFEDKAMLIQHMKTHTGNGQFSKFDMNDRNNLKELRTIHTREAFKCNVCGRIFEQISQLLRHKRTHMEELQFKCNCCGKAFGNRSKLKQHMKTHTGIKPFKCGECSKVFYTRYLLVCHMRIHSGERPFKCIECGKAFRQNSLLRRHSNIHVKDKPYKCKECGKGFDTNCSLMYHHRTHTGEKPFKCNDCNRAFIFKGSLNVHRRIHTGEKLFTCCECDKIFIRKNDLIRHMPKHTGEKPFKCNTCGKNFSNRSNRHTHMKTHAEKSLRCNECGKTFTLNVYLIDHMRTHTGEKPYTCGECGKAFKYKRSFIRHKRIHVGDKTFKCNECGQIFSQNIDLIGHKKTHRGERLYRCNECDRTFSQKICLHRHMRIHTGEKPYKCDFCDKTFNQYSSVKRHKKLHTGDNISQM